jgi:cytochrome c biogenesis protein CcmG/thiol:disulfide interchange protein DsbE
LVDEPVARRWPLRLAAPLVVAGLLILLGWATLTGNEGESLVARIAAGEEPSAPPFELDVLWPEGRGGTLALESLRGRPVVLNFWASWCVPCREEAPLLNAAARAREGEVVFVGVNIQDLRPDALAFLREFDVPYASVRDRGNDTYEAYGLTGVPETYYLDAEGRIVAHTPGAITAQTLAGGIEAAG